MVNGHGKTGVLLLDASSQEEQRAKSRFVFAWAFGEGLSIDDEHMSRPESEDNMEVDEKSEVVGEAELIWAEAEGEFARQEVLRSYANLRVMLIISQYEDARKQSRVATVRILEVIRRQIEKRLT